MADTAVALTDRPEGPRDLADWLLARGRHWATSEEVATLLAMPLTHVSPSLARWIKKGFLFSPTKGVYVPIPPEYRSWGAVPASHFIDPLMRHLDHDYYVCLLTAAEAHGFAHQRPQQFQVMTSARLRDRSFGRVQVSFVTSSGAGSRPTISKNTPTGTMRVSTPEATALDLVSRPLDSGGLSNVATILAEMIQDGALDLDKLADVAAAYPVAVAVRTGWLLEFVANEAGSTVDVDALHRVAGKRGTPAPLEAYGPRRGPIDERWNVIINGPVEPDL